MKFIINYKLFESENKLFRDLPISEYTTIIRSPNISCFNERDITIISSFLKNNNIKYQFKNGSLLPLGNHWAVGGSDDIDIEINDSVVHTHLTDGSVKSFDVRDYANLSYDEIDALGENGDSWFTLKNFYLSIPNPKNIREIPIIIFKCYSEYYIVDMGEKSDVSYLCDQIDGLVSCLSSINIQNEEYKHVEYLYSRVNSSDMVEAMNRDVGIPKSEMDIITNLKIPGKEITIKDGIVPEKNMQIYCGEDNTFYHAECLLINISDKNSPDMILRETLIEIIRTDDEYYMANVRIFSWDSSWGGPKNLSEVGEDEEPEYYKCDSIDGLVQFIELVSTW